VYVNYCDDLEIILPHKRSQMIDYNLRSGVLFFLLYQSSACSPESGLLSDWSKNKMVFEPCSDWLHVAYLTSGANELTISIRPPSPRNNEVNMSLKDILVVLGELSSFLSLLRKAFGSKQAVSHL